MRYSEYLYQGRMTWEKAGETCTMTLITKHNQKHFKEGRQHAWKRKKKCMTLVGKPQEKWQAVVNMEMNLLGYIKCWEIPELLSNQWLLKNDAAPPSQLLTKLMFVECYITVIISFMFVSCCCVSDPDNITGEVYLAQLVVGKKRGQINSQLQSLGSHGEGTSQLVNK